MTTVLMRGSRMSCDSSVVQSRNPNLPAACLAWLPLAAQTEISAGPDAACSNGMSVPVPNTPAPRTPTDTPVIPSLLLVVGLALNLHADRADGGHDSAVTRDRAG